MRAPFTKPKLALASLNSRREIPTLPANPGGQPKGSRRRDRPAQQIEKHNKEGFLMIARWLSGVSTAALALPLIVAVGAPQAMAQVSGQVTSADGPLEGVVVSAKRAGSAITISLISNAQGRFTFPADRVEPGQYSLEIRAAGYELEGPKAATVTAGSPTTADLKLRKTRNLSKQLTNAEWMASIPGSDDDKLQLLNCVSCHTLERIVKSTYDADQFVQVITRMNGYAQVSQPIKPQRRVDQSRAANPERFRKLAEYLATINLSTGSTWAYELKTMPRVKGRAAHVIIPEYDLPRATIEPHDVIVVDGTVYYTNFGEQFLGKLDPKTGKATEFAMQEFRKGFPQGNLDLGIDKDKNLWIGMMYQGAVAKFDPKTEKFQYWNLAPERLKDDSQLNMVTNRMEVDGKLWVNDAGPSTLFRLDLASGKFEEMDPLSVLPGGKQGYSIYDVRADSQNNAYVTDFQKNYLVKIDAKTLKTTVYQTGTPQSRNRRGRIDDQDRFFFAQYRGNKISMFDTKEERMTEYPLPTKFTSPYDVIWDKNGELWTGGMTTDRVVRVNPKTGETVEYPLARDTNMRRMFVDNTTARPTFWVGSNHGASIVKVEPLD
jgi:virginiamycin B lyase